MKYKKNTSGAGKGYSCLGHLSVATEYNCSWAGRSGKIIIGGTGGKSCKQIQKVFILQKHIEEAVRDIACE